MIRRRSWRLEDGTKENVAAGRSRLETSMLAIGVPRSAPLGLSLLALDKLYTVAVWVFDEEDACAATHCVWLALEIHATCLF